MCNDSLGRKSGSQFPRTFLTRLLGIVLYILLTVASALGGAAGLGSVAVAQESTEPGTAKPTQLIEAMFPKATTIGEKELAASVPAWPVYQLNELIGYAYESKDMVDFPGFSGETMNFLIGIDMQGTIRGVDVLYHHEPIFMHGLGPQPFHDFLGQYAGRSIAEQIVVGKSGGSGANVTYFDGVTKATVSVNIANDTVLVSALKLARDRIQAFAQGVAAEVREDVFEARSWNELLDAGLLKVWELSRTEVEAELGSKLEDFADDELYLDDGDEVRLFYAYLNPPSIGRNLLGDANYERLLAKLSENEHAFAIMSEGFYAYIPSTYKPGTVPDRISLQQSGLPINIRDTNLVDAQSLSLAADAPQIDNFRIFKTRAQAGLDPSLPMQMQLNIALRKNHLVSVSGSFLDDKYQLPERFFRQIERTESLDPKPMWIRLWDSRKIQIAILIAALTVLTIALILQERLTRNARHFQRFRFAFLSFTLFFIGLYAQGQLSVVNIFAIQLALRDGFNLDMFLLDPVLFILWTYTFISLFIVGRGVFCGWLCPFGAMQSAVAWVAEKLRIRQWRVSATTNARLAYLKYIVLASLMGVAMYSLQYAQQGAEIEPFKTAVTLVFVREWPFVLYAVLLLGMGLFINKFFCRYVCPLGAGLAVLGRFRLFDPLQRRAECGSPCQLCAAKCETAAIKKDGQIDYNECVQCLECVVILRDPQQCAPVIVEQRKSRKVAEDPAPAVPVNIVDSIKTSA